MRLSFDIANEEPDKITSTILSAVAPHALHL